MKDSIYALVFISTLLLCSCSREDLSTPRPESSSVHPELAKVLDLPAIPYDYSISFPDHFLVDQVDFPEISDEVATLGRVLFYDPILSANNKVSCASCHHQDKAFADPVALSEGFEGFLTKRNSFALGAVPNLSATYNPNPFTQTEGALFWDGRAETVQEQIRLTLQDSIEMGADLTQLPAELAAVPYYPILFEQAFGHSEITEDKLIEALSQFLNALVTTDTRFDAGFLEKKNAFPLFSNFSREENIGKLLFIENCSGCHGSLFTRSLITEANNGLKLQPGDIGIAAIRRSEEYLGVFKVPVLRNVAVTAPYMHDGRFETLRQVIDHYSEGIQEHPNLHPLLMDAGRPRQMNFSEHEKEALVAFLHTLTDESYLTNPKYSNPFLP